MFKPKYSYEYNCILNRGFSEKEQIRNFASLITDKDRFFILLKELEDKLDILEKYLGFKLPKEIEFYVVRAELFESFSEPITIEYSLIPEEMVIRLVKEVLKTYCPIRFPSEEIRDKIISQFLSYILPKINERYSKFFNTYEKPKEESLVKTLESIYQNEY